MDPDRLLDGRLKIRHLVLIVALADCQGVMRAAESLTWSQPAVTRGLKEVEVIFGCELFERHPRGVVPTAEGSVFIDHARALLGQLRQVSRQVAEVSAGTGGSITVGTHFSGSERILARAVLRLKERNPHIVVTMVEEQPDALHRLLIAGEIDLIVGRLDLPVYEPLDKTQLFVEPIDLVVRAQHPATELAKPALEALRIYPWIIPPAENVVGREIRSAFAVAGLALPANRTLSLSLSTPQTMILESDSIAPLPANMVMNDTRFSVLHSSELQMRRPLGVMQLPERPMTAVVTRMLAILKETASEVDSMLARPTP